MMSLLEYAFVGREVRGVAVAASGGRERPTMLRVKCIL